jgi:hypothetical protein
MVLLCSLHQLYVAPIHVTDREPQPRKELKSVAAGDTLQWKIGDTESGRLGCYKPGRVQITVGLSELALASGKSALTAKLTNRPLSKGASLHGKLR